MNTVGCEFQNTSYAKGHKRVYTYKTLGKHEVGDLVVVNTLKGYQVITVVEVHDTPQLKEGIQYKWIKGTITWLGQCNA